MQFLQEKKDILMSVIYYGYVFFISFMVSGNSFFSNYNISYSFLYILVAAFLFYKKELFFFLFSRNTAPVFIMLALFSISALLTPLNLYYSYVGVFKIYSVVFLGFLTCFLMTKKVIDFFGMCLVLAASGLIHVLIILYMWFTLASPQDYDWVRGLYFSNNIRNFSDYMSICFFCSLFLIDFYKKNIMKFLFLITSILILSFIFWSGSRAAYLGVFSGFLFYIYYFRRFKVFCLVFCVVICSIVFSLFFQTNHPSLGIFRIYSKLGQDINGVSSGRLEVYKQVLDYFSYHPIWGYGGEAVGQLNVYGRIQAHNSILQILIEYGLVGLIYITFLFSRFVGSFKHDELTFKQVLIIIILLNIFISSLLNSGGYYVTTLSFMCLFIAAIYAEQQLKKSDGLKHV